jgi:hypothetical protein
VNGTTFSLSSGKLFLIGYNIGQMSNCNGLERPMEISSSRDLKRALVLASVDEVKRTDLFSTMDGVFLFDMRFVRVSN